MRASLIKLNRAWWTTAAFSSCISEPKKMVAPKMRWKAPISRRYWEPPCCMPKVSNISRALGERDRAALLPDRQGGEEKGNQAILAPRQPIGRMTGDLQQELSVSAFVEQDTIGRPLDRQATKNEGPGGEAQGLGGGISLQADALNGFQLPKFLLGKRSELRALKYSVSFLKAAGSRWDVRA